MADMFDGRSVITVTEWVDPYVTAHGYSASSDYVEWYWLPVLGPTALLVLRRLHTMMQQQCTDQIDVDLDGLAASMGLSRAGGFDRALTRLTMFGIASPVSSGLVVRTMLPVVARRHVERWPSWLREAHDVELEARVATAAT